MAYKGYVDKEQRKEYLKNYMVERSVKQKASREFANERITGLMKAVGMEAEFLEKSGDGFVMLRNWLLPKFTGALRFVSKDYMVFDDMLITLQQGFMGRVQDTPQLLARGLAHVDGRFMLLANWIRYLSDYMDNPDEFNRKYEYESFLVYINSMRENKPLPPDNQPGATALRGCVEKDGLRHKYLVEKSKGEKRE